MNEWSEICFVADIPVLGARVVKARTATARMASGSTSKAPVPGATAAVLRADRLEACLFVGRTPALVGRTWLAELFARRTLSSAERASLLAGRSPAVNAAHGGRAVCACGVGENAILAAIRGAPLISVTDIGERLKAGSNCGSCIPELQALLARERAVRMVAAASTD